jgi:hypothetical protein
VALLDAVLHRMMLRPVCAGWREGVFCMFCNTNRSG